MVTYPLTPSFLGGARDVSRIRYWILRFDTGEKGTEAEVTMSPGTIRPRKRRLAWRRRAVRRGPRRCLYQAGDGDISPHSVVFGRSAQGHGGGSDDVARNDPSSQTEISLAEAGSPAGSTESGCITPVMVTHPLTRSFVAMSSGLIRARKRRSAWRRWAVRRGQRRVSVSRRCW
jgi:hypothetical protein